MTFGINETTEIEGVNNVPNIYMASGRIYSFDTFCIMILSFIFLDLYGKTNQINEQSPL